MMSFTPTTYAAASNPSCCPPSSSRLIFAACGFGVFAWGDRACATADLLGDRGPPVEPSCIASSESEDRAEPASLKDHLRATFATSPVANARHVGNAVSKHKLSERGWKLQNAL